MSPQSRGQSHFLVTGVASGIGRRIVGDLLRRNHRVMATDLTLEGLESASRQDHWEGDYLLQALDVTRPEQWEDALDRLIETWDSVDVVMNIAGYLRPAWIAEATDEDIHRHLDVNVKGVIFGTRAAAGRMIPAKQGHIVNMASLASMSPVPGIGIYAASKYAVRGFSMAAAQELKEQGVAVSTVCPDAVQTPMLDLQKDYTEAAITFTAPRFLTPEQISDLVLKKVLPKRPVLVSIPKSRAFLARLSDLFPSIAGLLAGILRRQGDRIRLDLLGSKAPVTKD